MYFVVTLALKMLIYAIVNSAFSGFASLKLHLFIQPPKAKGMAKLLLAIPYYFNPNATLSLGLNVLNAELLAHSATIVVLDNLVAH